MKCGCTRKTRDMRRGIVGRLRKIFGNASVKNRKPTDGPTAPDVTAPHVTIACARARRTSARNALRDAWTRSRFPDEWVVAVCQDDGERPYVAMTFEDFAALLGEWHHSRLYVVS
jgi:hypothetical protein